MTLKWVIFDVGETLFSEQRLFNEWAKWLGVDCEAFWLVLRDYIAAGEDHRNVFSTFDAGFNLQRARAMRAEQGRPDALEASDIYPDALPAIRALVANGLKIGVAGNQPTHTSDLIRSLEAPIELIGMSDEWNLKKPDPAFFQKLIDLTGTAAHEIAYVGDRLDNDVLPAQKMGMRGVFLERGPWGEVHGEWPEAASADIRTRGLISLPSLLGN